MTATTATVPVPSVAHDHSALWTRIALLLGGVALGATATLIIHDTDSAPARTATPAAESQFRDASAAEASRYVDSLEAAGALAVASTMASPEVHRSADAIEHSAISTPAVVEVHRSADAVEHSALATSAAATAQPGFYPHGYDYSSDPGVCTGAFQVPC